MIFVFMTRHGLDFASLFGREAGGCDLCQHYVVDFNCDDIRPENVERCRKEVCPLCRYNEGRFISDLQQDFCLS